MKQDAPLSPRARLARVVLWMSGALISFSTMAVSLRELSRTLGVFDMLSLRSGSSLLILLAAALLRPALFAQIRTKRFDLHLARNIVHYGGTYAWSYAVTVLPLALVFTLEFTAPIWTAVLASLFLGERLTRARIGCVALGFLGILLIMRPGASLDPRALWPLAAAVLFAITFTITRAMTRNDSTYCILFWMNAIQLPLNLVGADWSFVWKLASAPWLAVAGVCTAGLASHFCITNAFRHGDAILVAPLDFLRIPLIALVGWRFYNEPLDPLLFAGAALIISGILWSLRSEARRPAEAGA
ncbi:DMT family transporter [Terrarubrum flagellatum]|uniref:DMT family transporter n=1 Tax=Terrirubrum flagellatum TaxID=2895980 RepID=UPI003145634F